MSTYYYSNCSSITSGCYLYSDPCSSIAVPNGYYSNGTTYYIVTGGVGQVTNSGPCTGYTINVYAKLGDAVAASCAIYYKFGINGDETFLATVNSAETTCQFQGAITGVETGTVLYIGFKLGSGYIQYNAQEANNLCPSNLASYCGLDYNRTITNDFNLSMTAYVTAGFYSSCTPIYTSPTPTPTRSVSRTPSVTPSRTPSITVSKTPGASPSRTPSVTPSRTPSITITPSRTPSITITPSRTPAPASQTPTRTTTPSVTKTPTRTPTRTPSSTPDPYFYYNATGKQCNNCTTTTGNFVLRFSSAPVAQWYSDGTIAYQLGAAATPPSYDIDGDLLVYSTTCNTACFG